jgi:hypothetical protein
MGFLVWQVKKGSPTKNLMLLCVLEMPPLCCFFFCCDSKSGWVGEGIKLSATAFVVIPAMANKTLGKQQQQQKAHKDYLHTLPFFPFEASLLDNTSLLVITSTED